MTHTVTTDTEKKLLSDLMERDAEIQRLREALRDLAGDTPGADSRPCWCHEPDCRCRNRSWCAKARAALAGSPVETRTTSDVLRIYPCERCGVMRSKDEGGTTFTVCDACWDATSGSPVERKEGT